MVFERVFVDLDGVVANFISAAFQANGRLYNEATYPRGEWEFHNVIGRSADSVWAKIDATDSFWEDVSPYSWGKKVIELAATRGPVAFLSSPSRSPACHSGKKVWVDRLFPGIELILCTSKQLLAGPGKLLIDDSDANIYKWRDAGGAAVLFPQPWNENHAFIDDRMNYLTSQLMAGTNPKDLLGQKKPPLHLTPRCFNEQVAAVMAYGAYTKGYQPYNWRLKSVRRSIYYDAALRHIQAAIDGEDLDPESGIPHEAHAAACMAIILDAEKSGNLIDDRPQAVVYNTEEISQEVI